MLKQRLKVIAVAGFVVVALTGFSRHGHSHSSGGGGGCSGPSHTSSSSTSGGSGSYDSDSDSYGSTDDPYDSTNGSYGSADDSGGLPASTPGTRYGYTNRPTHRPDSTPSDGDGDSTVSATAKTVSCAHPATGGRKAVTSSKVEVKAAGGHGDAARVYVDVRFADAAGSTVDRGKASVMLKPGQTKTITVDMSAPSEVSRVDSCEASVV
ncbi:hypothetical protein [Streptomyces montanisoli]|uniref:Uncharacterized protein n=1 Tax=Streptomyces montanisoli TaxID=2798581 RepID=A0A940MKU5_9ACTN|nr:hypothetical protein [Streptomyces montanisoli]MBP0461652.1 hypothetical protein [Streptomyces montanisoli]